MHISMIGSINTYLRTLKMHQTWTERQQNGDPTGKAQSLDEWIQERTHEKRGIRYVEPPEAPPDLDLQSIQTKVSNGKKLTPAERTICKSTTPKRWKKRVKLNAHARTSRKRCGAAAPRKMWSVCV